MPDLRITHYDSPVGREAMLRFGPQTGPIVVAALPLFEEANRTRAAVVDTLRRLAARGIGCALPDLPGMGESVVPTRDATLSGWRTAFAAAVATLRAPAHVMAWRGGVLIDAEAQVASRWQLAPTEGASVVRELGRVRDLGRGTDYAGNILSGAMLTELGSAKAATSGMLRVVRLSSDPRPADVHIEGSPLWRAAEPDADESLQAAITNDIAAWIVACDR